MKHARKNNPGAGAKPNYLVAALIGLPVGYFIGKNLRDNNNGPYAGLLYIPVLPAMILSRWLAGSALAGAAGVVVGRLIEKARDRMASDARDAYTQALNALRPSFLASPEGKAASAAAAGKPAGPASGIIGTALSAYGAAHGVTAPRH